MYLKKIRLQNIKCFEDVTLELPHTDGDYSGWNVVLGENGFGKSAILQCIAMQLYNQPPVSLNPGSWARGKKGRVSGSYICRPGQQRLRHGQHGGVYTTLEDQEVTSEIRRDMPLPSESISQGKQRGWVAAGYGPFRRLSLDERGETLNFADPRFLTLFYPFAGLTGPLDWLPTLYSSSIDPKSKNRRAAAEILNKAREVINNLLPDTFRIEDVTTEEILFRTRSGHVTGNFTILSDGFRSFLALAGDLLEQIFDIANEIAPETRVTPQGIEVLAEGIVLIDEADAHLHPSWQRELGERLRQVFPKIQFIVTTHSPFIAQEATDGGLFVLRRNEKGTVDVEAFPESVRGWTATQILTSPLFGLHSTRSVEMEGLVQRNTELLSKPKLTATEKRELNEIKTELETRLSAPGETYEEMNRHRDIQQYVEESLKALKNGKS